MVSELAGEGAMPLPKPASHAELQVGLRRQIRSSLRSGVDSPINLSAVLSFQSRVSRSRFVKSLSNVLIIPMFAVFNRSSESKSMRSSAELVIPLFAVFLRSRSAEILSAELVAVVSSPQRRTRKKNQLLTQIRDFASEKSQGKRRISNLKNRIAVFNRSRVLVYPVFAVFDRDFGSRSSPQRRTREMSAELVNSSLVTIDCSSWSRSSENLSDSRSSDIDLESGMRVVDDNFRLSKCVLIARLYLEDDDAVNVEEKFEVGGVDDEAERSLHDGPCSAAVFYTPVVRHIWTWLGISSTGGQNFKSLLSFGYSSFILVLGRVQQAYYMEHGCETMFLKSRKGFVQIAMEMGTPWFQDFVLASQMCITVGIATLQPEEEATLIDSLRRRSDADLLTEEKKRCGLEDDETRRWSPKTS
nr:diacylglycerol O-acyltransferase 2-like [Ipomoea batatas]